MEFDLEKFGNAMSSLWNETAKNRFDLLYSIAFTNNGEIPKGHSSLVFSSFRSASVDVQKKATELSGYSLKITGQRLRDFYVIYPQKSYETLSVEEKADIEGLFVVWSKTSLIVQVLQDGEFKRDTLVAFLEESLSEMTEYVMKGKVYEAEMYTLLLEGLCIENISREDFLALSDEQREACAMKVLRHHVESRLKKYFGR